MSRPAVLQFDSLLAPMQSELESRFAVLPYRPDLAAASISSIEFVVTSGSTGVPREVIAAMPQLRAIVVYGAGTDNIDLGLCQDRTIEILTSASALSEGVAEMAFAQMLAVSRNLLGADRFVRSGAWGAGAVFPMSGQLWGKRLGVFGFGAIGQSIGRRAAAGGMDVGYHNRSMIQGRGETYFPTLADLADWADVLAIAAPGGDGTRHAINADILGRLGPDGIVVNVARGSIVDETALVAALHDGRLGAACLDVFASEPMVSDTILAAPRLLLSPYAGSNTMETRSAMARMVLDKLEALKVPSNCC
ncbi:NAD(P)-dependent oxidoreductase [Devosia salina]|uniref:2-hydroxyacid dehydrogenase n=1 Tax=Devosia salina TaxID=2860336 RepID=A0ABX8WAA0_9HYPH|nr:NAD(P)-dependent oxidoreductase [Devosia salina]QYO75642.1 2-hydroxyacid dehydrogenase [Devosia salina]